MSMASILLTLLVAADPGSTKLHQICNLESQIYDLKSMEQDIGAFSLYQADPPQTSALVIYHRTTPTANTGMMLLRKDKPACEIHCDQLAEAWRDALSQNHATWNSGKPTRDVIMAIPGSEVDIQRHLEEIRKALEECSQRVQSTECELIHRRPDKWAAVLAWDRPSDESSLQRGVCFLSTCKSPCEVYCEPGSQDKLREFLRNADLTKPAGADYLICVGQAGIAVFDKSTEILSLKLDGKFTRLQTKVGAPSNELNGFQICDVSRVQQLKSNATWNRFEEIRKAPLEQLIALLVCSDDQIEKFSTLIWLIN